MDLGLLLSKHHVALAQFGKAPLKGRDPREGLFALSYPVCHSMPPLIEVRPQLSRRCSAWTYWHMSGFAAMMERMTRTRSPLRPEFGEISREVAWRMRVIRVARGLTREEVEARCPELSKGHLSKIESGKRGRWLSVDIVARVARVLNVDVGYLITGEQPKRGWRPPPGLQEAEEACRANPRL